jgi:putative sigma-54 modulation protein
VNLILSGRGVDLDDSLRRYATEKFSRVQRFFDRIIKMEVELTEQRTRHGIEHRVDVTVATPGDTLRAEGVGVDHFAAIDKVTDRLERQVKRMKNRLIQSHREPKPHIVVNDGERDADEGEPLIVRRSAQLVKPLEPEEAMLELESRGLQFLLFTNAETMRSAVIYRRKTDFGLIEPEN